MRASDFALRGQARRLMAEEPLPRAQGGGGGRCPSPREWGLAQLPSPTRASEVWVLLPSWDAFPYLPRA